MASLCANSKFDARHDDVITSSSMNEILTSMPTDNMKNFGDFAHDKNSFHFNYNNISTFCLEKPEPTDLVPKSNTEDAKCDDAVLFDLINKTQNGEEHASLYSLVLCRLRELASCTSPAVPQSPRSEVDHQDEDQNDRNIGSNCEVATLSEQTFLKLSNEQTAKDLIEKSMQEDFDEDSKEDNSTEILDSLQSNNSDSLPDPERAKINLPKIYKFSINHSLDTSILEPKSAFTKYEDKSEKQIKLENVQTSLQSLENDDYDRQTMGDPVFESTNPDVDISNTPNRNNIFGIMPDDANQFAINTTDITSTVVHQYTVPIDEVCSNDHVMHNQCNSVNTQTVMTGKSRNNDFSKTQRERQTEVGPPDPTKHKENLKQRKSMRDSSRTMTLVFFYVCVFVSPCCARF